MSLTNKIVANIKKTNVDINSFLNTNNIICIDTSTNRIGIGTKSPQCALDISGDNLNDKINTYNLQVRNLAEFDLSLIANDISTNNIISNDFSLNIGTINTINNINSIISANFIRVLDLSLDRLFVPDLSSIILNTDRIFCDISGIFNEISVNSINVKSLTISGSTIENDQLSLQNASINTIDVNNINCNILLRAQEADISNNIDICGTTTTQYLTVWNNCNIQNLDVNNNLNTSSLVVTGNATISNLNANTITGNSLYAEQIYSNGQLLIDNGQLQTDSQTTSTFGGVNITNELSCNIIKAREIESREILDLSGLTNYFLLPKIDNVQNILKNGNIAYDYQKNIMKIFSDNWYNLYTKQFYNNYRLNKNILGNDISNDNEFYFITNSTNLLFDICSNKLAKYIPIIKDYDFSYNFFIDDNYQNKFKSIKIENDFKLNDLSAIYEINADITLQFLNKNPGDVEANTYTFGIYSDVSINNNYHIYREIKNTILVFDNSFNYANSSINYIGKLKNATNGFSFYIQSIKDLSYLAIDSFNVTIKLIN